MEGANIGFSGDKERREFICYDGKEFKRRMQDYFYGELPVKYRKVGDFHGVGLGLAHDREMCFFAIMPENLEEVQRSWPNLVGKGKVMEIIEKVDESLDDLLLYFPAFEVKSKMRYRLVRPVLEGKYEDEYEINVEEEYANVESEANVKVTPKGIYFTENMCFLGRGCQPEYKEVIFNKPFLFMVYHRKLKMFILFGQYLGPCN